jgi:gamma-glutamyltranspeptidase/glutathione hydrolase
MRRITTLLSVTLTLLLASSVSAQPKLSEAHSLHGMVVTVSPPATRAGLEILAAGGNAVDAAIAVEFALAVAWPEAGNIGGGGFMMVHPGRDQPTQPVVCIDYREIAPRSATESMFNRDSGRHTHLIVGVPGTVHGMLAAHRRFGSLKWKRLLAPAIRLADEGFNIDAAVARSINRVLAQKSVRDGEHHQELRRVYGKPDGSTWQAGNHLTLPDLAETLERIADDKADGFYDGKTARLIAREMKRGGGIVSRNDLDRYRARVRPAVRGTFRGHDIYGAPPPSSGGTCVVQMLNVLELLELKKHPRYSARNLHVLAETMKRAFCDRARYLGDADFVDIPGHLVTKPYAKTIASSINLTKATPSQQLAPEIRIVDESPSTTHFSVADSHGMAVSNTTTLEGSWGARIVVRGAGFVLNNEMGDFNWFPDHTDTKGRIGTEANLIRPGKRMLSSQSPTIVARNGRAVLVTGSPGGRTIINTSLQMVLGIVEFGQDLPTAMRAPRIHHQWLPDRLIVETFDGRISDDVVKQLQAMGHSVSKRKKTTYQGDAHSILIDPNTGQMHGVADFRRNGLAAGL